MIGSLALIAYIIGGQTMCFAVLSLSQLFHAFNMRSEHSIFHIGLFTNPKMILSFIIGTIMQVTVISVDSLARIFKVIPLSLTEWITVFLFSIMPIIIVEFQKKINSNNPI